MNKPPRHLFAPEGEITAAGGDGSTPPAATDLNEMGAGDAAASIFKDKPAAAEPPPAAKPPEPAKEPGKDAPAKPADGAKPSIFDATKPKPAEPPKPAEHPEDKITLSEKAKPETTKQFGELKTITKTLRAEADQLRAELAEAKKTPAISQAAQQEVERLRAEHKAAMDRLAIVDLKSHPSYAKQFVEPLKAATESVKAILADYKMENIDVAALVAKPRAEFAAAVNEIVAKLPLVEQVGFVNDIRNIRALEAKANEALTQASALAGDLQKKQTETARAAFNETLTTLDFVKAGGLGVVEIPATASAEDRTYFEGYNASAKAIPAEAEKIAFGGMGDKDVARVAIEAATFRHMARHVIPRMDAENKALQAANAELLAKLEEMKGSVSVAGGADSTPPGGSGAKTMEEMSTEEAIAHIHGAS